MYALVTGASSGIGRDCSIILAQKGYDLILVARDLSKLEETQKKVIDMGREALIFACDLADREQLSKLFLETQKYDVKVVINNAGFGKVGMFNELSDETDYQMIDVNVTAMHMVLKEFASRMDNGYILTVASIAAFSAGPKMATYYATKNYIYAYARALNFELKKMKKKVSVTTLCPGPVNTNFNDVANVKFALKGINSFKCANFAIKKMFKRKAKAVPTFGVKFAHLMMKLMPKSLSMKFCYKAQSKKEERASK